MRDSVEANNPAYLMLLAKNVSLFKGELRGLLIYYWQLPTIDRKVAAWTPKYMIPPTQTEPLVDSVSRAAGRAKDAALITDIFIRPEGSSVSFDPIMSWHRILKSNPPFTPGDIYTACDQIFGRLETMARQLQIEHTAGIEQLHELIWESAKSLWVTEHRRSAVSTAAEALVNHVRTLIGRRDIGGTELWQEAFSVKQPNDTTKVRLRWPGNPTDETVRSMNDGLRRFAPGVQLTIRNLTTHGDEEITEQEGLERLATLSLLARWVDQCELVEV